MAFDSFPEFSREDLAEMGGWTALRTARRLQQAGSVRSLQWEEPLLSGEVEESGRYHHVRLDLRSRTFVRNQCECPAGRRGQVCAHALAVCLQALKQAKEPPPPVPVVEAVPADPAEAETGNAEPAPDLQSIRTGPGGTPMTASLQFPPNFEAAAERNAIVLKLVLEVDGQEVAPEKLYKGREYALDAGLLKVLSSLESLAGGNLYSLVQLKRDQLKAILETGSPDLRCYRPSEGNQPVERAVLEEWIRKHLDKPEIQTAAPSVRRSRGVAPQPPARPAAAPRRELLPDNWMVVDGSPKFLSILLRDADHPQYRRCAEWLRGEGFRKEPSNGKWWLRDQHKVLNFLALHRKRLERDYDPGYTDSFRQRTAHVRPLRIELETRPRGSGYALRLELSEDGLDAGDVRNALVAGRHYIIGGERIHLLERDVLEKFDKLSRSLGGDPNRPLTGIFEGHLTGAELAHTQALLEEEDLAAVLPEDWKERSAAIREVGRLKPPPLPEETAHRFRAYQLLGTAWLWHLYRNGLGGILADEMGLGKTIQAIGLLLAVNREDRPPEPALIVAPASLLGNWQRELATWAPGLEVCLHHGPGRRTSLDGDGFSPAVVLTSYSTLRNDRALFQESAFSLAIADEAQHVKNRRSHASRSLRSVSAGARFILTGTPIENSTEDLRALFDFCLPGYLKRPPGDLRGEERQWYERQDLSRAAPYILRRGKAMVAPELPEKIEQTVWCELEPEQRRLYQGIREKSEQTLMRMASEGASENRMRFTMLTELLRLRQVCADPGLLDPEIPLEESAKFRTFRELLSEAMDGGHRLLVFSQFVTLLKRLRDWFETEGIPTAYIDGSTRDRLAVCDRFNRDPDITACLISLKAGGTGLNLTGADTVIHFDPWWNPAVEDQATDRAHRIGQSRTVTSYKLATEGTVEDKVLALQIKKSNLLQDLLDESAHHSAKVDLETLKTLLS
jgi:superfamily II DNA or RNA helicase